MEEVERGGGGCIEWHIGSWLLLCGFFKRGECIFCKLHDREFLTMKYLVEGLTMSHDYLGIQVARNVGGVT